MHFADKHVFNDISASKHELYYVFSQTKSFIKLIMEHLLFIVNIKTIVICYY
jgi:hypothetical protein